MNQFPKLIVYTNNLNILGVRHFIVRFGVMVGHLNVFLVLQGGNLNKPIFKSSNAWGIAQWDVEVSNWSAYYVVFQLTLCVYI